MARTAENEIPFGILVGIRERFASSMARHWHRISVKSKGADLVARKLATKFGEEAHRETVGGGVAGAVRGTKGIDFV